jgi:hypothetical protein
MREIEEWKRIIEFESLCRYFTAGVQYCLVLSPSRNSSKRAKHKIEDQSLLLVDIHLKLVSHTNTRASICIGCLPLASCNAHSDP